MKVLWIVHDVLDPFFPFVVGNPTKGSPWIDPLFFGLSKNKEIKMGVITPVVGGEFLEKVISNIHYYAISIKKGDNQKTMKFNLVKEYLKAIDCFSPDIIHIHGVEKNFGLLRKFVSKHIPIVCSIQGIITSCNPYLNQSSNNFNYKRYRSLKNRLGRGGIDGFKRKWNKYKVIEQEIFSINQYFIGRTLWDKSQTLSLNQKANYFQGEELLREPFYNTNWGLNECERNSIFISSGSYPLKGLHLLIEAVNIVKEKYPNLKIYVPLANIKIKLGVKDYLIGEDYSIYISHLVKKLALSNNFIFLKRLSAKEMAEQFSKSHVFTLPSYIENSSNAFGEAMMVGTPTIAAFTGGIGSIVENEKSSLFFPIGDYRMLAHQIDRVFSSDDLALKLSENAKEIAKRRHNIQDSVEQYITIYKEIIKNYNENIT